RFIRYYNSMGEINSMSAYGEEPEAMEEEAPPADLFDDLFGPADEEAPADEPAMDLDDLFGPPADEEAPADDDDPFGSVPPAELPMRNWVDNTGHFEVEARLVVIMDESVRLLKDNGRTTTVPMYRLSQQDQQYVQQMIAQVGYGELGQFAAR
ncbi:MAG: hypothetical protein EA424_19975, partial [Planctomycetaceae bacterium]